jgi:hypothetical protein
MVNLKKGITIEEAKRRVSLIWEANSHCQTDYFAPDNKLDDSSIYWLYCWANNGDTSDKARVVARKVWNDIFDIPYEAFNESVFYEIARKKRKKPEDTVDESLL